MIKSVLTLVFIVALIGVTESANLRSKRSPIFLKKKAALIGGGLGFGAGLLLGKALPRKVIYVERPYFIEPGYGGFGGGFGGGLGGGLGGGPNLDIGPVINGIGSLASGLIGAGVNVISNIASKARGTSSADAAATASAAANANAAATAASSAASAASSAAASAASAAAAATAVAASHSQALAPVAVPVQAPVPVSQPFTGGPVSGGSYPPYPYGG